jgi:hypothetical protein
MPYIISSKMHFALNLITDFDLVHSKNTTQNRTHALTIII